MVAEFHLLRPGWLLSLLPLAAVWWALWRHRQGSDRLASLVAPHLLEHLRVDGERRRWPRPLHGLALVWLLSALALAGPTWEREPSPFASDDAGLVVVLKVSGSMDATDVQPSRLERAKHKLHDLLALRDGQSTGLVVYSGSAHLVMPLTRDGRIVDAMAADLSPKLMPVDGDALAAALAIAEASLRRAGVPGSVLVIADRVAPAQAEQAAADGFDLPLQFLAVKPPNAATDPGMVRAVAELDAALTELTIDSADVARLAGRARSRLRAVADDQAGEHWRDAGYYLLPLVALLALAWSRRGWLVR